VTKRQDARDGVVAVYSIDGVAVAELRVIAASAVVR